MPLLVLVGEFIGSIWSAIGVVSTYIIAKITAKVFFTGSQIVVSVLLITKFIVVIGFFVFLIPFLFNKYNDFLALLVDMATQSENLSLAFKILQSLGIINAFNDVFAIFSEPLLLYFGYRASLVLYSVLKRISDELFKAGVLTQE